MVSKSVTVTEDLQRRIMETETAVAQAVNNFPTLESTSNSAAQYRPMLVDRNNIIGDKCHL